MAIEPTQVSPNPELMRSAEYHNMSSDELLADEDYQRLFNYQRCEKRLQSLIDSWEQYRAVAEKRRAFRNLEVDIKQMQADGELKPDEIMIPIHTIDENIRKEKPNFINFLKQSRRLCVFTDEINPEMDTQDLEQEFTKKNTFIKWDIPHEKLLDGAQVHGWDQVEVEFDATKPGMVGISHIGHENLHFQTNATDIEDCEEILRRFNLTIQTFTVFAEKHGFEPDQVKRILEDVKEDRVQEEDIVIYKRFHKYQNTVYVSWFSSTKEKSSGDTWLREPKLLFLGRREQKQEMAERTNPISGDLEYAPAMVWKDVYESQFPVILYPYAHTEEPRIVDHKGRYFMDREKQMANTALWSVYINGCVRASNIYASPEQDSESSAKMEKYEVVLESQCIYTKALRFWSPPYPNSDILRATNALDVKSASEQGDVASAVINREDSRKTAKEITNAEETKLSISSVSVGNFATYVTEVYQRVWGIQQSLALQNVIPMLETEQGGNDFQTLSKSFIVKASGDIDVVKRQEKLIKRFQAWPMVAETPIRDIFLLDILTEMFPEDAPKYMEALRIGQAKDQAIMMLSNILNAALVGDNGEIRPEFKEFEPQLQQLAGFLQQGQQQAAQRQAQGKRKVA